MAFKLQKVDKLLGMRVPQHMLLIPANFAGLMKSIPSVCRPSLIFCWTVLTTTAVLSVPILFEGEAESLSISTKEKQQQFLLKQLLLVGSLS